MSLDNVWVAVAFSIVVGVILAVVIILAHAWVRGWRPQGWKL